MSDKNKIKNDDRIIEKQPLKLLKNRSYPSYQLYATVSNSKIDPNKALIIAVLETMSWLRKRFRNLEIPNEIRFPEPDDYESVNLDDFKSFRINEGYVVDVIYIKEKGIWSFHLIEPDLGPDPGNENQKRKPIPGRVFETNIAFKIDNGKLQCGFKTICSEPIGIITSCEVFRLAVVKSIIMNKMLGLEQIIPINQEPYVINSVDKVNQIIDYIKSNKRQLPFVLFTENCKEVELKTLIIDFDNPKLNLDNIISHNITNPFENNKGQTNTEDLFQEKIKGLIKHRMGYAQFGFITSKHIDYFNKSLELCKLSKGDVRIIYPLQDKIDSKLFNYKYIVSNEVKFFKDLENEMQDYPKSKNINYGNVKFFNDARIEELQQIIQMSNSKEDIVNAYDKKIKIIEHKYESKVNMLNQEINEKEDKIDRIKVNIKSLESKNNDLLLKIVENEKNYNGKYNKLLLKLERKDKLLERPKKTEEIPEWVDNQFRDRLILHEKAKDLIINTPNDLVDMELLCDAIEFLAHEYIDEKVGNISLEERNMICSETYNRSFEVGPSGDISIKNYSMDYKVKYRLGLLGKAVEVPLDLHLKGGNDPKNLLRIYFFFDKIKQLIVVGSLPRHLKTVTEK